MITVSQDSTNKIVLDVTTSVTSPYFLIRFTNCTVNISTIALFALQSSGSFYIIHIVEVGEGGVTDPVNGELRLGPAGDWQAEIWAQTSSTNLNPNLADEFLEEIDVIVIASGCTYSSDDDGCPTIDEIDGGDSGSDLQFNEINGLLDGCSA
jgi:hypothetical protein